MKPETVFVAALVLLVVVFAVLAVQESNRQRAARRVLLHRYQGRAFRSTMFTIFPEAWASTPYEGLRPEDVN